MGHSGKTELIDCKDGGLVMTLNHDSLPPSAMVEGTRNINFVENGRESRGGSSKVNDVALAGAPSVLGEIDFTLRDGSKFLIMYSSDGKVWKNYTEVLGTLTPGVYPDFTIYNNKLYICNGVDIPRTWNGTDATLTTMTQIPSTWSGSNQPAFMVIQRKKNFRRLTAGGAPDNPHILFIADIDSANDPDFSDECVTTKIAETNDGFGLVGGVAYGENTFYFGKRISFKLDDSNSDVALWGFNQAPWEGGAAHQRLIVRTPNDIVCGTEEGEIYSFFAVQESNDLKSASLARPAFIDEWLRRSSNLGQIKKFHSVYDPLKRALRFFIVRAGQTEADTCLLFFIDRKPEEAWMLHDNLNFTSGMSAASSALVQEEATGKFKIYTGGQDGFIRELETASTNDDSNAYHAGFMTPAKLIEDPRSHKNLKRGIVSMRALGNFNLEVDNWVDETKLSSQSISMLGKGVPLDTFLLDTDSLVDGHEVIEVLFGIGKNGKRIQTEFYNETVNERFFMSHYQYDYKTLGRRGA